MRRTTAAVVGTLAGAGMLLGVRLTAAPVAIAATGGQQTDDPTGRTGQDRDRDRDGAGERRGEGAGNRGSARAVKVRGTSATNPYGQVQVTITVSNGRITKATATYPTADNSGPINAQAIPRLNEAVVTAQGADVDSVSGATYTSAAYRTSLQAAVDKADL